MTLAARLREEVAVAALALQFLTRLPVPAPYTPERLAATPRWYPAVGALVGALAAAALWLAGQGLPASLAALVSTAVGLLLTGAFHEDGFADACDGLGGGRTREQVLEIMRDSRLGTYGAAGLGLMLAAKVTALAALPLPAAAAALIAGHAASRASAVAVIATSRYVRDHGTGKPVATGLSRGGLLFALATAVAALLPLCWATGLAAVGAALAGLAAGHLAMRSRFERRLGGYTGDCLGAVQQCSEIGFLLALVAVL